jgi:hypothetical protein
MAEEKKDSSRTKKIRDTKIEDDTFEILSKLLNRVRSKG